MVSEWRVVGASITGVVVTYFVEDFITIENLNGDIKGLFFSELEQFNEKILGVVPLANDCWIINIIDKLEQKALNCLDIEVTNLGECHKVLGNFVCGECMTEVYKFVDLLYDTLSGDIKRCSTLHKVNDLVYSVDSRYNSIMYRTVYTIQDLHKFKLLYTKYNISRSK